MSLSRNVKSQISSLLITKVRDKIKTYKPETAYMPFHHRLLGRDRYAMFSFIHSMNTTFGMSIWEQVAQLLAEGAGYKGYRQYKLLGEIDPKTEELVRSIHHQLRECKIDADVEYQNEQIRHQIRKGKAISDPDSVVDLLVVSNSSENYFDITSVKPNIKEFVALKLKLLRWVALRLSQDRDAVAYSRIAIPYNPYYPEPYERWTLKGLYDLDFKEILVGDEFWNYVANDYIYNELLDIFQKVGETLRSEIDRKFAEFK